MHQRVHRAGPGDQRRQRRLDVGILPCQISCERDGTGLVLERREASGTARHPHHVPAGRAQSPHRRLPDTGACPRHHSTSVHHDLHATQDPGGDAAA